MALTYELKERINQITNLPTLPQVATRLMQVVNDPNTSASDVAAIISQDLSLSAKVLRLANSAFYGIPRSITNINNAVVILGLRVINTIILSVTVFDMFPQDRYKTLFDRKAFWRHSLGCALISKMLASVMKKFIPIDTEEAFCAGLLHDIGKVVMEQYIHDDFHEVLAYAEEHGISAVQAEQEVLNATHCDVAEWLTSGWDLPAEILQPIIQHHTPDKASKHNDIVSLCHFADYLCYETGLTISEHDKAPTLFIEHVEKLGIPTEEVECLKIELSQELEKMAIFFDIATS